MRLHPSISLTISRLISQTEAINEIIEQSASEILKMYLLDVDRVQRRWTPEQAWLLVKQLAKQDSVRFPCSLFLIYSPLTLTLCSSATTRSSSPTPTKPTAKSSFKPSNKPNSSTSTTSMAGLTPSAPASPSTPRRSKPLPKTECSAPNSISAPRAS